MKVNLSYIKNANDVEKKTLKNDTFNKIVLPSDSSLQPV